MLFYIAELIREHRELAKERRRKLRSTIISKILEISYGPDLLENNSAMLRSGELFCRSLQPNSSQWSKDILLFLFDQSIVICKKDLIKKNFYIFKERMSLQQASVVDVRDGKEPTFNVSVKNSFKLVGPGKQYLFSCADKKTKSAWLAAFDKRCLSYPAATAEEKRLAIATLNSLKLT